MKSRDPNGRPHHNDDGLQYGLNWQHYLEATRVHHAFLEEHFADVIRSHRERNADHYVPVEKLHIAEENKLLPVDGYFSLFCDILGFSMELTTAKLDCLPDFYGAAYVAAADNPDVKVYVLSDSCLAFASHDKADCFIRFVSQVVENMLADGILPQCFVGYGSFVERVPDFGKPPSNFFGCRVVGTALVDAANIAKSKPLGARILLSSSVYSYWPAHKMESVVPDGAGNLEFLPERPPQFDLFDCLYYLLCLRNQEPGTRIFHHYIWSFASRALRAGGDISQLAVDLARPHYGSGDIGVVITNINEVLDLYASTISEQQENNASKAKIGAWPVSGSQQKATGGRHDERSDERKRSGKRGRPKKKP